VRSPRSWDGATRAPLRRYGGEGRSRPQWSTSHAPDSGVAPMWKRGPERRDGAPDVDWNRLLKS